MRKTVPSHVLAQLTSNLDGTQPKPSRRKRAVKAKLPLPTIFDRVALALQPALDDVDTAWA